MKEIKYLFKKMAQFEPSMFVLTLIYAIFIGLKPFLWIISPAYIIKNYKSNPKFLAIFFIGLIFISTLVSFFDSFVMGNYRMKMNNVRYKLMNMVTEYSLYLPYALKKDKEESEKINNATKAVESPFNGAGGLMMTLPEFLAQMISLTGFIWIFLRMDFLVVMTTLILTIITSFILSKVPKIYDSYWTSNSANWNRFAKVNNEMRSPLSKQDILIFDITKLFSSYYMNTHYNRIDDYARTNKKATTVFSLAKFINLIRDAIIIYWLSTSLIKGTIDIGDFYVYFTAVFAFINFNTMSMWIFSDLSYSYSIFKPFFEIIKVEKEKGEEFYPEKLEIRFDSVYFKYPESDDYILKNLNLTIKNNESIALVGENGAGKSTLAMLLAGFYKPSKGRILFNGKNLQDLDINYNKLISSVFQDSSLFPFSIRENILLKDSNKNLDAIYKMTHLDEIIDTYKQGENQTLLRILDDNGVDLSGGQKQRLFLARAIAKEKTKILILDEPTAQLDALNERELYQLYHTLVKNKSSIFISHRLASTKFCDRIIYMKDGEILASGSHEELMQKNDEYRDLYNLQAKNYKEVL
ncbi:ABC transporter ATP-binding protein [Anaerococcus sp. WCA-380-WT-2B]|uniref:ABC transporter ATP-binding protein n=2 Tax=Anaerococcus porci TaxID=2652269 RepID=A0A6N7VFZ3_9FIRM|nr:ABC transporter ATP-binding protein [Anaerococcus porci]MSS78360.1 ABC transporter ATP-binding protein [Anaerococcus porci]